MQGKIKSETEFSIYVKSERGGAASLNLSDFFVLIPLTYGKI
jgi:hypothetical protein